MSEMIERVARAAAERADLAWEALPQKRDMVCGHGMPEGCRDYWFEFARAAIEAMREPTEEMKRAAYECATTDLADEADFRENHTDVYQAMIDAALGAKP